ncbi:hypothetical protein SDC9_194728 [bioreactor metagenome]|uniref:Uncharacterized protein n=1 Tax=bioreactor metagenome TaxID=1076179 RepID=A0A645I793_9ZZZZ
MIGVRLIIVALVPALLVGSLLIVALLLIVLLIAALLRILSSLVSALLLAVIIIRLVLLIGARCISRPAISAVRILLRHAAGQVDYGLAGFRLRASSRFKGFGFLFPRYRLLRRSEIGGHYASPHDDLNKLIFSIFG